MKLLRFVVATVLALLMTSSFAFAGSMSYQINGNYYSVVAGESVEISTVALNLGEETPIDVDFKVIPDPRETPEVRLALPEDWVTVIPANIVGLGAMQQMDVKAVVEVPEDAEPGVYGVTIQASSNPSGEVENAAISGTKMTAAIGVVAVITVLPAGSELSEELIEANADGTANPATMDKSGTANAGFYDYSFYFDMLILVLLILLFAKVHSLEECMPKRKK